MRGSYHLAIVAAAVAAVGVASGCYSTPDDAKGRNGVDICAPEGAAAPAALRRLADAELAIVLSELAGEPVAVDLPLDPLVDGFDNHAGSLVVSPPKLDGYVALADRVAPRIAARHSCDAREPASACAFRFAQNLARRLYGRSLTDDEAVRLRAFDSPVLVAKAMLLSPHTLYRTELGSDRDTSAVVALEAHEVAGALSFLITGGRPSESLLEAAERGELATGEGRIAHARALLELPAARAQVRRLVRGWLGMTRLSEVRKYPPKYPEFTPALRDSMERELDRFIDVAMFEGGGTLADLLGAARAYPDEGLARIYGDDLREAASSNAGSATDPSRRRGILTLPAFLSQHAATDGTNPVDRGLVVRSRLFCDDFGSPPLIAQMITIDRADAKRTTRQKFEAHTREPACASCHASIDAVGFAFESFDGIGRHRSQENRFPIDASGVLVGTDVPGPFADAMGVVDKLLASDQVRRCFATQVARFAGGTREDPVCRFDEATALAQGLETGRALDVLLRYVARPSFVMRRRAP